MFDAILNELVHEWYEVKHSTEIKGKRFTSKEQFVEYKLLSNLIKSIKVLLQKPRDQKCFNRLISDYIANSNIMDSNSIEMLFNKEMIQSTVDFYEQAKEFNPDMKIEDIGQAMRNIWIINMIQQLECVPVKLTRSAFGYSMLYPYTDNFIDATHLSNAFKRDRMIRFGKRLKGEIFETADRYELELFDLVEAIESDYCRLNSPMVFESLMSIHNAQMKSQQQQQTSIPYEYSILNWTFEKGGTSVFADACIVCGQLTEAQIRFYLQYGIVLQLCDDFQDLVEDYTHDHQTIFSQLLKSYPLDVLVLKTLAFNDLMIERLPNVQWAPIYKNCILMMLAFSSLSYRAYLSPQFFKNIGQYSPLSLRHVKKLKKEMHNSQNMFLKSENLVLLKTYVSQMSLDI